MSRRVAPSSRDNELANHRAQRDLDWRSQMKPGTHWSGTYVDAVHTEPGPPAGVLARGLAVLNREQVTR